MCLHRLITSDKITSDKITSDYATQNIFSTDGSMIDDVAGFAVHNRNYETGHQLAKPSSVFSAEVSAIRMALEHIQICHRGRYLILSETLSSLMAIRSRWITYKGHPWIYDLLGPSAAQL
jgi:hypothetical protein